MSISRALRVTIATVLAATAVVFAPIASPAQAADPLSIGKAASDATVESGQLFEYTVLVSCSTSTGDCDNAVVTDVLPPELSGAAEDVFLPPLVGATASYDEGSRTVTWTFDSDLGPGRVGLPTGSTVELLVGVRFPAGTTPDGTVATNTASFTADVDGVETTVVSSPVDVTSTAGFAFDLVKSVGVANIGLPVTYDIELCSDPTGGLDMEAGSTLVDTLPAGAEFLGATNGGAETTPGSGIVEWTPLPAVAADGQCHVVGSVTVLFPDDVFVEGEIVTNTASVTDPVPLGATDPEPPINASIDTPLVLPTGEGGTSKSGPEWITPGQPFDYTLTLDSTAFLPITDAVLVDTIPDQVDVTAVTVPAGVDRAFYTSDDDLTLRALTFTPGTPVLKSDLVGAGDFIASLQFEADSLDAFTTLTVVVGAEVIDGGVDRQSVAIVEGAGQGDGTTVTNCTTFTYVDHESTPQSDGVCHSTDVKQEFAVPRITKTSDIGPYLPGATVSWDVTITNTEAASTDLDEFVIRDLLPDQYDNGDPVDLTYVPGSAALVSKPAGAPAPVIDDSATFAGRTQLEWRWTTADLNAYSLAPGETITVTYEATFGDPVPPGTVTNHASLSNWLNEPGNTDPDKRLVWECDAPAVADADLVALNATDTESRVPCYASSPVNVQAITGLGSVKWVRGEKDVDIVVGAGGDLDDPDPTAAGYTRFPSSGFTYQGGYVDYRLVLNNPGNVPIDDLVLVDIFPFVGDTGVLTGARGSEWRPILVEPVALPSGLVADVYYSVEESPCLDGRLKVPTGCTDWSLTPPIALNEVRAVMIDIEDSYVIPAGGSLQIPLSLTAPAGTPVDGAIAWNSFAFSSRRADTGSELLPAEPRKVGVEVGNFEDALYGDYVWFDFDHDGIQDAEETGPELIDEPYRPTGINGVRVQFYEDNDGTPGPSVGDEFVRVTYTQDDFAGEPGYYSFPELDPGTYYAVFDVPAGYDLTLVDAGGDDELDSDADFDTFTFEGATITDTGIPVATQVVVPPTGLGPLEEDLTWDVGFWDPNNLRSSLGDRVFYDNDTSGVQETTEDGVENVTVNLWWVGEDGVADAGAGDDFLLQTATTDAGGNYRFDWLVPGPNYYVEFVEPTGLELTTLDTGSDDDIDSDADPAAGFTELIDLDNGPDPAAVVWDPDTETVETQWDAGLYVPNSIGDFVWEDLNRNGLQETGDVGIGGVVVTLYSPGVDGVIGGGDDVEIDSTTTLANGFYEFTGLPNGDYFVVVTPPADHLLSPADVLLDDTVDSDGEAGAVEYAGLVVMTSITTLQIAAGADLTLNTDDDVADDQPRWDFGLYQLASIGDYVWEDLDRDGVQETGEPGINGVTVTLLDALGNPVPGAVTATANNPVGGAPGWYSFTDLEPDTYSVRFDASTAPTTVDRPWFFSPQDLGADTADSDVDPLTAATDPTELVSGENDPTWDAGIWRWASIGDYVWHDLNGDGIQTALEPGINGVLVTLLDAAGDPVPGGTTVTGPNPAGGAPGWYEFDDLEPDTYSLHFNLASPVLSADGFVATGLDDGTDDLLDSDIDRTTGRTTPTQLTSNEHDPSWDAGFYVPVSLGDYVWYDSDVDGLNEPSDEDPATNIAGVNGVTVRLLSSTGAVLETTTTADDPVGGLPGWYEFDNLRPGTYEVEFVLPTGFSFSPANADTDDTIDSDAVVATATTARTGPIVLVSDNDDFTWDAGIYQFAGLGDFVWDDLDADGVQDPGEPGINGVTVILLDINGDPTGATTVTADDPDTGAPGWYEFTQLVPGVYSVQFDLTSPALDGYEVSPRDTTDPASPGLDSDASPTDGTTIPTSLDLNEFDPTWDAGFYLPASLGDFVWDDLDGDGVQDPGEPGINDVTVILLDAAGDPIPGATTITAADPDTGDPGFYEFTDLVPGTYAVQFDLTSAALTTPGYVQSPLGTGTATDSDAGAAGITAATTLVSGENDSTWDAGFYIPVAVGDFVWEDLDGNGFQDPGEPGINDVTVRLLDAAGDPIPGATTVTANHPVTGDPGFYEFTGLEPGVYAVQFDLTTAPLGFIATIRDADAGVSDATDSDADATTGITAPTAFLESGDEDRTLDLGLVLPVGVGDYVWQDVDGDGIQDAGEPPISGVDVDLYLVDPDGGAPTYVGSTTTVASGLYQFNDLAPGSYFVEFDLDTLPTGMVATLPNEGTDDAADSDADPTTGRTAATAFLESQDSDITLDLGAYYPVTVGDFVWNDLDGDGIQDSGEPTVPFVVAYLLDADGNRVTDGLGADLTATTDGSGFYEFTGLVPGAYAVEFDLATLPTDFVVTFADQGSDDTVDSDADATTGITTLGAPIPSGGSDPTHDLGIYAPVSVGDYVWEDVNGDGIQDAGEPGVDGVDVTLYLVDPDGGAPTVAGTTSTTGGGGYLFTDLPPGSYYVEFDLTTLPTDFVATFDNAGTDDGLDSDADRTTGTTAPTPFLQSGAAPDLSLDLGIYAPVSVGDFAWDDLDGDGTQDDGEPGVEGVGVTLFVVDPDGGAPTPAGTTTTGIDGSYLFGDLPPAEYFVVFDLTTLPGAYVPTFDDVGDEATDSDADPASGETRTTGFLASQSDDVDLDLGLFIPVSVGDYVWFDESGDGVQDAGEPGVPDVDVTLWSVGPDGLAGTADDVESGTDTTDADGRYLFADLPPGDYYVVFDLTTLPAGQLPTLTDRGGDDTLDSDADRVSGMTAPTGPIPSGSSNTSLDLGIVVPVVIGDLVWEDTDADGIQDDGEPGIAGVTVNLFLAGPDGLAGTADDVFVESTTTSGTGDYLFVDQVPGEYFVEFDLTTLPSGYVVTVVDAGSDDTVDSDGDPVTGITRTTGVLDGTGIDTNDIDLDLGVYVPATLGDFVWQDRNGDGTQQDDEPGVPGVTVRLVDPGPDGEAGTDDDVVVDTTTTDSDGEYLFVDVVPGTYVVEIDVDTLPDGAILSPTTPDCDCGDDSDVDPDTARTGTIDVPFGGDDRTWDAGIILPFDLQLTKVSEGEFLVNATGTYVLVVSNSGPGAALGPLQLVDELPEGLTFDSAAGPGWSCSADGQTVTCLHADDLPSGARTELRLVVGVTPAAVSGIVNSATVESLSHPQLDTVVSNDGASAPPVTVMTPIGDLPRTGGGVIGPVTWAAIILAAGIALAISSRRRRSQLRVLR